MTATITQTDRKHEVLNPSALVLREPVFGERTKEMVLRVQALQNRPSPGSLPQETVSTAGGKRSLQEHLFDALADVKILTSRVAMHLDREWRNKLFCQLDSLHDPAEWEEGDQPIQQSSFSTFLKAILDVKPARRPGLGLSHTGHLIAAWTTGQDRLTIEFLPNDRVRWVLSRYRDDEPERFAGDTGVARLAEGLATYHPEHWFEHAQKKRELA